jgi:hypothetical protein
MRPLRGERVLDTLLEAIQSSSLSQLLASERWLVTANSKQILETLHFIAFALQIGAVMVISLRLVGCGRNVPIAALRRPVFWTAWLAFAVVLLTGALQFVPIATEIVYRPSFRAKLAILGVALVTLIALQVQLGRRAIAADAGEAVPCSLKVLAVLSLALWPTVVVVARLMYAFVQMADV